MGKILFSILILTLFLGCIGGGDDGSEDRFIFDPDSIKDDKVEPETVTYGDVEDNSGVVGVETVEESNCTFLDETRCISNPACTPFYAKCDNMEVDVGGTKCIGSNKHFECLPLKSFVKPPDEDPFLDDSPTFGVGGEIVEEMDFGEPVESYGQPASNSNVNCEILSESQCMQNPECFGDYALCDYIPEGQLYGDVCPEGSKTFSCKRK